MFIGWSLGGYVEVECIFGIFGVDNFKFGLMLVVLLLFVLWVVCECWGVWVMWLVVVFLFGLVLLVGVCVAWFCYGFVVLVFVWCEVGLFCCFVLFGVGVVVVVVLVGVIVW